jgi:mannose-6-phosphate isomerase-like protein (cupin superfamily)
MCVRFVLAFVLMSLTFSGVALAEGEFVQLYPKDKLIIREVPKVGGGIGTAHIEYSFTRDKALAGQSFKEIAQLTLPPGATVGLHKHESNEDAYIVISGTGNFVDTAGKETPVKPGDITIARKGESHGINNTGNVPLVFYYLISAQQ